MPGGAAGSHPPPRNPLPSARRSGITGRAHAPLLMVVATQCGARGGGRARRVGHGVPCRGTRHGDGAGHDGATARGRDRNCSRGRHTGEGGSGGAGGVRSGAGAGASPALLPPPPPPSTQYIKKKQKGAGDGGRERKGGVWNGGGGQGGRGPVINGRTQPSNVWHGRGDNKVRKGALQVDIDCTAYT